MNTIRISGTVLSCDNIRIFGCSDVASGANNGTRPPRGAGKVFVVVVGPDLLAVVGCWRLFCCCSRNHQVDSCELTCSIKRSHEQQQWYSTCLKRRTHTTVKLTYYSRLPSTRFCVINQVLAGMSGQNREPNTPVGEFDSKSKVVGEDCRPRTTVGHL